MWGQYIHINKTLKAVCEAIGKAETTLREHIQLYYHNAGEEFLTNLFYGHVRHRLTAASDNRLIENAFLKDLENAIQYHHLRDYGLSRELPQTASGLIADIVPHNKRIEGKTGGDFGLIIIHPVLQIDTRCLKVKKGQRSGLLCQAKLKDIDGKWNKLTENQKLALNKNKDFSSLVLYSYSDSKRADLNPILWSLCKTHTIANIEEMLSRDYLDELSLMDTRNIVFSLGRREIGTTDKEIINKVISPSVRHYFELRIYWPDDKNIDGTLQIRIQHFQKAKETVKVYQG